MVASYTPLALNGVTSLIPSRAGEPV